MNDATGQPQTAVVIGGTSEIARATLRLLVARRLRQIVLAGRDDAGLESAAAELRALGAAEVTTARVDMADPAGHGAFAEECAKQLGQIDMVLVAAGILPDQQQVDADPEAAASVVAVNFAGPVAAMTAFASVLRRQGHGRIVVLSSVAGVRVRKDNFVYGSSKAGLDGYAQGLADALHGSGVSVMIVRPGFVHTRMTAGRQPAPMAVSAEDVATDVVAGLARGAAVVWSPSLLRLVFAVFRLLPSAVWRRLAV